MNDVPDALVTLSLEKPFPDMGCILIHINCVHLQISLILKNELEVFLGIMNYPIKYSLATSEICEPLCRLIYVKSK